MRHTARVRIIASALFSSLLLGGCGGAGSTGNVPVCPAITAPLYSGTLVNPANGATGVPTTIPALTFTVAPPASSFEGGTVTLDAPASHVTAAPVAVSGSGYSVAVSGLAPQTTYRVSAEASASTSNGCPFHVGVTLGSFTTQ